MPIFHMTAPTESYLSEPDITCKRELMEIAFFEMGHPMQDNPIRMDYFYIKQKKQPDSYYWIMVLVISCAEISAAKVGDLYMTESYPEDMTVFTKGKQVFQQKTIDVAGQQIPIKNLFERIV